jgi:hypothetical protein
VVCWALLRHLTCQKGGAPMRAPRWQTILFDVHSGKSQMLVTSSTGEVLAETQVSTTKRALRRAVRTVPGPRRVIFEEGPLSALIHDALKDLVEEIISSNCQTLTCGGRCEASTRCSMR